MKLAICFIIIASCSPIPGTFSITNESELDFIPVCYSGPASLDTIRIGTYASTPDYPAIGDRMSIRFVYAGDLFIMLDDSGRVMEWATPDDRHTVIVLSRESISNTRTGIVTKLP